MPLVVKSVHPPALLAWLPLGCPTAVHTVRFNPRRRGAPLLPHMGIGTLCAGAVSWAPPRSKRRTAPALRPSLVRRWTQSCIHGGIARRERDESGAPPTAVRTRFPASRPCGVRRSRSAVMCRGALSRACHPPAPSGSAWPAQGVPRWQLLRARSEARHVRSFDALGFGVCGSRRYPCLAPVLSSIPKPGHVIGVKKAAIR